MTELCVDNNDSLLLFMFLCATLHLAFGEGGFDEELEMVGVVDEEKEEEEEEESGRVRLYSAAHSRPVVHERRSAENSSCSAL